MKKLLLIPTLGLTAITPVIAMTSCTKENDKKNEIVWNNPVRTADRFYVFSNELDTTAWLFIDEGSYVKCDELEKKKISLFVLKSDIFTGSVTELDQEFSIQIKGKTIKYNWVFYLSSQWDDCTSDIPVEVK